MQTRSDRPSLEQIIAMSRNTVRCQTVNTKVGQRLAELDAAAMTSLEDQLTNNVAQLIKGLFEQMTGIEY